MNFKSDVHNFGRFVTEVEVEGRRFIKKPRTVFWEWMFAGKSSPLANLFPTELGKSNFALRRFLFNLDVNIEERLVSFVESEKPSEVSDLDLPYQFGLLLGYASCFGITDLHYENLVFSSGKIVLVDIEAVFTKIILPNETLILPFNEIDSNKCGASAIIQRLQYDEVAFLALLKGFFHITEWIFDNCEAIEKVLDSVPNLDEEHIRVMFRGTDQYHLNLCYHEAESIQRDRGDVPYFFATLKTGQRFFYFEDDQLLRMKEFISPAETFGDGVKRLIVPYSKLLDPIDLKTRILASGILFLIKTFSKKGLSLQIAPDSVATHTGEKVTFTFRNQSFSGLV